MDAILGTLRRGGFSIEMAHHAFHVLDIDVQCVAPGTVSLTRYGWSSGPDRVSFLLGRESPMVVGLGCGVGRWRLTDAQALVIHGDEQRIV